jgi:hypothetical protein
MSDKNPLADEIRQAARPRLNLSLPARPEVPDQAVEAHSKEIGEKWGANTQMAPGAPATPEDPTAPLISVRFDCPDYLDRAVSVAAAELNVTKTFLILKALRAAGYEIKDVDLVEDRRKTRRR